VPYPIYALGVGSTSASSANPDGAAEVIDFVFSEDFHSRMNSVWLGERNMPLKDLSGVTIDEGVMPLHGETMATLAEAAAANWYGCTTWTFLPPATDTYLVSGMEEVWLGAITTQPFLETLDPTLQGELAEGKVPAIPARD
jgi:raffinose/stachyose/melibiose transport system substrate-binding protein